MKTSLRTPGLTPAEEVTVGRDRIVFKLTSEQSEGEVAVFTVRIPPSGGATDAPPPRSVRALSRGKR
jgi:hypothetical protein